jgi:hypothetical protein
MLKRKPNHSAETEELVSAVAAAADLAFIVLTATGR